MTLALYIIWLHVSNEITSTRQGNLCLSSHFTGTLMVFIIIMLAWQSMAIADRPLSLFQWKCHVNKKFSATRLSPRVLCFSPCIIAVLSELECVSCPYCSFFLISQQRGLLYNLLSSRLLCSSLVSECFVCSHLLSVSLSGSQSVQSCDNVWLMPSLCPVMLTRAQSLFGLSCLALIWCTTLSMSEIAPFLFVCCFRLLPPNNLCLLLTLFLLHP